MNLDCPQLPHSTPESSWEEVSIQRRIRAGKHSRRSPSLHAVRALLCTGLVLSLVPGCCLFVSTSDGIDDAYAMLGAADMVIVYMEDHDGQWPRGWDDLRPQFEISNGNVPGWSYSKFQDRIVIDFGVDVDDLERRSLQSASADFRVIRPRRDSGVRMGADPNQMLCDCFRRKP